MNSVEMVGQCMKHQLLGPTVPDRVICLVPNLVINTGERRCDIISIKTLFPDWEASLLRELTAMSTPLTQVEENVTIEVGEL